MRGAEEGKKQKLSNICLLGRSNLITLARWRNQRIVGFFVPLLMMMPFHGGRWRRRGWRRWWRVWRTSAAASVIRMMDLHCVMLQPGAAATREPRRVLRFAVEVAAAHRRRRWRHHALGALDTRRRRRHRILQQTMRLHLHQLGWPPEEKENNQSIARI